MVNLAPPAAGIRMTNPCPDPAPAAAARPVARTRVASAQLHPPCRRLGAGQLRRHPRAVHRQRREQGAGLPARQGRRLGHRRVRHAAARHPHPQRPRGGARQAGRPHAGDPAPDRPQPARLRGSRALGERTITLDCDVLQADGGTRTAAITGAYVALVDAVRWLRREGRDQARCPMFGAVAAVSVGIYQGVPVLDLDYAEDSATATPT
jgi:hypothetical protein